MKQNRFSREDWIALGFEALRSNGTSALTIDALCGRAGKTRGSFYFHFETMETFHLAVANKWKSEFTDGIIRHTPSTGNRTDLLNQLAARLDPGLETGMRQLAMANPAIAAIVSTADQQRIDWLATLYQRSGHKTGDTARQLARIEYAAFVGFRLVNPSLSPAAARELYDAFLRFTGRG